MSTLLIGCGAPAVEETKDESTENAIENAKIILNNSINYNILENANTGRYYMDHPRTTLGTLTTRNKFSLSSLFGIKYN